ncbi:MAG: hypothetical protein K6C34_02325 [Alphaproteobacteria bacterium]|nr:hypothetical protein [Alphaproteobacteria bacterium]
MSCSIAGFVVNLHMWVLLTAFAILCYTYSFCVWLFKKVISFFSGAPAHEKGLESLQEAFSALLLKDVSAVAGRLKKAKKFLGEIPIVSWLEGQLNLMNGDLHKAKSMFYSLSNRENHTAFGAYSLSQLAIKNGSYDDALNALDAVLKVQPKAEGFAKQAISIAIKNKKFDAAEEYVDFLKSSSERNLVQAVILYEKSLLFDDKDLAKQAFKLAPQLETLSLHYANALLKEREYRDAQKVIARTFEIAPSQKLFQKYIECGEQLSIKDKMKLAEKLTCVAPESWIAYFGLAEMEVQEKMYQAAFQNLLVAYSKEQYDFIAKLLVDVAEKLEEPKPLSAQEVLSRSLDVKHVVFVWKCSVCGQEESCWKTVCDCCNHVATFQFVEHEGTQKIQLEAPSEFL